MKKIIFIITIMLSVLCANAQEEVESSDIPKDVTTFLGIPVDGTKAEMRQKLIAKGYTPKKDRDGDEWLEGEFNGSSVRIRIVTNKNKVYRIMVSNANPYDEANVKNEYNILVDQFEHNKRYKSFKDFSIPSDEDFSYEMEVNNKVYAALYGQNMSEDYSHYLDIQAYLYLKSIYSEDELKNRSESVVKNYANCRSQLIADHMSKKSVWFQIIKTGNIYGIALYYDNGYNQANGEDL